MRRCTATALVGLLLLAACGSGGDSSDDTSSEVETGERSAGADASSETVSESESVDEMEFESPLGDFLGWTNVDFDEEDAEAEYAELDRRVQEAVAECMRAQGFEYTPVDRSAEAVFVEEEAFDGLEWGSPEWAARYGFGITTQRFSQQQVGPDLVGHTWDEQRDTGGEAPTDPNQAYVDSLSEGEREAYYAALYGAPEDYPIPPWEEEGREPTDEELQEWSETYEENYVPSGCEPVASEEIYNEREEGEGYQAFDEEFGAELQEMYQRMESHPLLVAHREEVRVCVEELGVQYLNDSTAYEYFEGELETAGLGWDAIDPFAGIDTSDFTDEDYERVYQEAQDQTLPPDQLEALADLQAEEIASAVALHECDGTWQGEMEIMNEVRIELEEDFLARNADRLAAFEGSFEG